MKKYTVRGGRPVSGPEWEVIAPGQEWGVAKVTKRLPNGCAFRTIRTPLYDSTFSRTVWRLYGGAKGLVV
jgi:hypothetical protein